MNQSKRIGTLILCALFVSCFNILAQKKKDKTITPTSSLQEIYRQLKWRNIGPFRGGRSVAVTGVKDDILTYYMGSTGGGVWRTEDGGITWDNITDGHLNSGTVGDIAIAPSDQNVIYVGMGEHAVRGVMTSAGDGVYRSLDRGQSWEHIGLEKSQHISDIVVHPNDSDIVYVAVQGALYGDSADRGVYKTTDGGKSWNKLLYVNPSTGASGLEMDPVNPRILYAAMWDHQRTPWVIRSGGEGSGIYKSTDSGKNWNKLEEGLPEIMGKVGISVSPANTNRIYAIIEAEGKKGGIYRSDDSGSSWTQTNGDRVNIARSWYYMEIEADPVNENLVYVLNSPLTKSVDGGKTFTMIPVPHVDTHDHWINPDHPEIMINANDGGAAITFNGGKSWSSQQNQPTAQFYRAIHDNRFPYYLYSGQQDNSAIAIPSQSLTSPGIDWKDWYSVAGGESAYLAFNPDDPKVTFGSSIQGFINRYDHEKGTSKSLDIYPEFVLGKSPLEMKYRFNWNPPLIASIHDHNIMYYGAQKVLKTIDGGVSWTEISPDLTRDQKDRQGKGGVPFTNEAAGGENYNTIMYIRESPHKAGVMYVGTDDGLVHLTKDGGKSWTNITPKDMPEAIVNAIDVSPHDPASAYVVAMRYKFNDFKPYIYKTSDYGANWQKITSGIEEDHFARVVREDKKVKGLLYSGTERGLYISYNNGLNWEKFQLNFPQVPITDLALPENDLAASTAGRGFWILDDLSPVQQNSFFKESTFLVKPEPAVKISIASPPIPQPNLGQNPPSGAIIDYYLPEDMDSIELKIKIFDKDSNLLRTFSSKADKENNGAPDPSLLSVKKGVNRTTWDLRKEKVKPVKSQFVFGSYDGHMVSPGEYFVSLITDNDSVTTNLTVVEDPRLTLPENAYRTQQEMLNEIDKVIAEMISSINEMRKARGQIADWNNLLSKDEKYDTLRNYGTVIMDSLSSWENDLIQIKQETFQDVVNMPSRLVSEFMFLKGYLESHDPTITQGAKERYADLKKEWDIQHDRLKHITETLIPAYNRLFEERKVPALIIEK